MVNKCYVNSVLGEEAAGRETKGVRQVVEETCVLEMTWVEN